jgi:hypothetical protein
MKPPGEHESEKPEAYYPFLVHATSCREFSIHKFSSAVSVSGDEGAIFNRNTIHGKGVHCTGKEIPITARFCNQKPFNRSR